VIYIVPKSQKRIRVHSWWPLGGRMGWLKVVPPVIAMQLTCHANDAAN